MDVDDTITKVRELAQRTGDGELLVWINKLHDEILHLIEGYGTLTAQLDSERELQPRNGLYWRKDAAYCPHCWDKRKQARLMNRCDNEPGLTAYRCESECQWLYEADANGYFHPKKANLHM